MIKGVLLDIDGTLIDSNESHARSWCEALGEFGVGVSLESVREKIGKGGDHLLPELTGIAADSKLGKQISERRGEIFRGDFLPHLRAFSGARALLQLFSSCGLRFLAATSASEEDCKALLKQAGIDDLLTDYTTAADADASKPDPDILEVAIAKLGLARRELIMLGDTPYDLEAAERAGIRSVAFTCGGWPRESLGKAMAIYQGPWDLLAAFERSPFGVEVRAA